MKTYRWIVMVLVAASVARGATRASAEEETWAGQSVLPTKTAKDIKFGDRVEGEVVSFPFSGQWPLKVRDDREGWLRIHDGQREGWADKADFVLVRDAPAYFHRRVQANPNDSWALFMRGGGWLAKGEPENAIKDFNECIRLDPTDAALFNSRGNAWNAKKDYDKAIQDFDEAIRLDPRYVLAFNNRGNAWQDKKDYDKAIKDFDEAIRLDPSHVLAFFNRGVAWQDKKDFDKAIRDYDETIRLDPKYMLAFYNRGLAWQDKKEYDKAIRDYDEAIRLDPRYAWAFGNRGVTWRAKKEYDKAIKDFDEAIRLDPKHVLNFNNRGATWRAKKDYDKAIRDYDEAIRLDPRNAWAHHNRSVTQMLLRRPEAVAGFQNVLDMQGWKGNLSPYAVILGHLAARQTGNEAEAKRYLDPSTGKLDLAWPYPVVQFLRGEIDEAALLKLATDDGKRVEARCLLGLVHALKGGKDEALAHFRWVKEHSKPAGIVQAIALAELDRLEQPPGGSKP